MADDDMAGEREFNKRNIEEFRANGGKVGGMFAGAPLILLTTTGAKSGKPRTSPLVFMPDGDKLAIAASKGGAPTHPDWFHNIRRNPEATVELGSETFPVRATILHDGPERDRVYQTFVDAMPNFGEYQKNTDRVIPVVLLERIPS